MLFALTEVGSRKLESSRRRLKVKLRCRREREGWAEERWRRGIPRTRQRAGSKAVCHSMEWKSTRYERQTETVGHTQEWMDGAQLAGLREDIRGFKNTYETSLFNKVYVTDTSTASWIYQPAVSLLSCSSECKHSLYSRSQPTLHLVELL